MPNETHLKRLISDAVFEANNTHGREAKADRLTRRRNLLLAPRGPNCHRELAAPLQHDQAARLTWIQATSTGGVRARLRRVAGCATPSGSAGHAGETANFKLTFHLDHSAGADHAGLAYLCFRHADTPERRIRIKRIGSNSVGHAPLIVIQDVRSHDLEIVVRRMRKCASAVTVSHRPDPWHVSTQLIVNLNIA